jgi:hypothetical protein
LIRELIVVTKQGIIIMSNYSSWDRSSHPADTKISMLPTSDTSIALVKHVDQRQALSDCTPTMIPSVTTTSNTNAYHHQQKQQQQQQVVQYPEFMQLGKRKFQPDIDPSIDLTNMTHHSMVNGQYGVTPSTSSSKTSKTASSSTIDDNEAGLSLLFAASLIQQQGNNNVFSTQTSSTRNYINNNVVFDAATTTKKRIVSCESVSIDPLQESCGQSTKTTELNHIDSTENKMISSNNDSEFIEPTAHDGMLLTNQEMILNFV